MKKAPLEKQKVRPDSHESHAFPTSARPVIYRIMFMIGGMIVICILAATTCRRQQESTMSTPQGGLVQRRGVLD